MLSNNKTRWKGRFEMSVSINTNEQPIRIIMSQVAAAASVAPIQIGDNTTDEDDDNEDTDDDEDNKPTLGANIPSSAEYLALRQLEGLFKPAIAALMQMQRKGPIAHLVGPVMTYLKTMYTPSSKDTMFLVPERSISFVGKNNRPITSVNISALTEMCKRFITIADEQLSERWATMPRVFMVAVALSPFMTLEIGFHKNRNLIDRAAAFFDLRVREVVKKVDDIATRKRQQEANGRAILAGKGGDLAASGSTRARQMIEMAASSKGKPVKPSSPLKRKRDDDGLGGDLFRAMMGHSENKATALQYTKDAAIIGRAKAELAYLASARVVRSHTGDEIVAFYNQHRLKIPHLALLFRATYPARGTEAQCESVFSAAGFQWNKRRNSLLPQRGGKMIFIRENKSFRPDVKEVKPKYNELRGSSAV